jgi:hypothetical protein
MSTIDDRYPELTELHHEFMRALTADPKPLCKSAFFLRYGIEFDRNPRSLAPPLADMSSCYI